MAGGPGRAVMSEQGVQEGTEHAPLSGPRVEDQHGGCVVTYPYHIGVPFVQVGKDSVECNRDRIICGSVRAVCILEWV